MDSADRDFRIDVLESEVQQVLVEELALCSGGRDWWSATDGEVYDVDPAVDTGPVALVRRSDGARFLADLTLTIYPEPAHG